MHRTAHKTLIFAIVSTLVIALVYWSTVTSYVSAVPANSKMGTGNCTHKNTSYGYLTTCCWQDNAKGSIYTVPTYTCQKCKQGSYNGPFYGCQPPEIQFRGGTIEPPSGGGGVLKTQPGPSPRNKTITPDSGSIFNIPPGKTLTPDSGSVFNKPQ